MAETREERDNRDTLYQLENEKRWRAEQERKARLEETRRKSAPQQAQQPACPPLNTTNKGHMQPQCRAKGGLVSWNETRKTPANLARTARPNLSDSVLNDPTRDERRQSVDLLNILSGLPGAEVALAKGLGGLGMMGAIRQRFAKEMPFHSDMKLGRFSGGREDTTPLFVDPDMSDIAKLMRLTNETSIRDNSSPTIRFLRDNKTGKLYAADGNEVLHSEMRGHLGVEDANSSPGELWTKGRQRATPQETLEKLRTEPYARGGLVQNEPLPETHTSGYNNRSWDILGN